MKTPDNLEHLPLDALIPYARNSRTHSDAQVAQIAASMREFGFTNPVLIDAEGGIIAGHGRVLAARQLGLAAVPCIRLGYLTEAQRRAYVIADNKLAEQAGWDAELLALELRDLQGLDFDLGLTGFSDDEIAELLGDDAATGGHTDPDEVPPLPQAPVSRPGDVWRLGRHRVMCGDSTNKLLITNLVGQDQVDVVVFDPPYDAEHLYSEAMPRPSDGMKLCVFWDFKRFAVAPHCALVAGWSPCYELIWDNVTSWYTPNRPLARHKTCGIFGDPRWDFDAAIIRDGKSRESKTVWNTRGACEYVPLNGAVHLRTVESFPTTSESGVGHAHSKPIQWIEAIFNGLGGNVYLDLFGGAGSTVIACEKTERSARVMEIDPRYCDVIVRRWQQYTGQRAILESTGEPFPEADE